MAETLTTRLNAAAEIEQIQAFRNLRNGEFVDTQSAVLVDQFGSPLTTASPNRYGEVLGLGATLTATVTTFTSVAIGRLFGWKVTGTGDARFSITLDGAEKYFEVVSIIARAPGFVLPVPHEVAAGVVVVLSVTNTSNAAASYQGVLLVV